MTKIEYEKKIAELDKSFGVAIRTCGLIFGLTVLGTTVAFIIFKFILFIGDKLNVL